MKNTFEWLEDAKKDIAKFADTDIAKLSERKMRQKESNSYAASCVSQETRSKAGKIGGAKNVESGHFALLKTTEHQSMAGTISGNKHKESGHIQSISKLGGDASKITYQNKRLEKVKFMISKMQNNKLYTTKELQVLTQIPSFSKFIKCQEINNFIINTNPGQGKVALYKKIETKN